MTTSYHRNDGCECTMRKMLLVLWLSILKQTVAIRDQNPFVYEPVLAALPYGGKFVIASVSQAIRLNCSVIPGQRVSWNIKLPGPFVVMGLDSRVPTFRQELTNRGFSLRTDANMMSSNLTIQGRENNNTEVTCVAHDVANAMHISSTVVRVVFYDYARSRIRLTIDFGEHGIFPYQAGDSFISRRYTCDSKYGTPVWLIQRPSSETILEWNVETVLTGFISDGLEALKTEFSQSGSEKSSKLRIHSRASTNYTVFSCIQFRNGLYGNQTEWFIYGFYGPPTVPTSFTFTFAAFTKLVLSWRSSFTPFSIPTTYHVTIGSRVFTTRFPSIEVTRSSKVCTPFQISLRASNPGFTTSSISISAYLLSTNTLTQTDALVEQTVQIIAGQFQLQVSFPESGHFCNSFTGIPVYSLAFTRSGRAEVVSQTTIVDFGTTHISAIVPLNSIYTYVVKVAGEDHIVEPINFSLEHTVYTTDVQQAVLMVDNNQDAFQLNCTFISGSVATGCILMLTGAFGTYSGAIPRTDTQGVLQHQVSGPVGAFSATVFDWEEDKRMGTVAFPVTSQATVIELLANRQRLLGTGCYPNDRCIEGSESLHVVTVPNTSTTPECCGRRFQSYIFFGSQDCNQCPGIVVINPQEPETTTAPATEPTSASTTPDLTTLLITSGSTSPPVSRRNPANLVPVPGDEEEEKRGLCGPACVAVVVIFVIAVVLVIAVVATLVSTLRL